MLKINGAKPKMNNAFPDSFCHSIPFIWMNKKRTRVVCLVFFRRYSLFRLGQNVMRFVVCVCVFSAVSAPMSTRLINTWDEWTWARVCIRCVIRPLTNPNDSIFEAHELWWRMTNLSFRSIVLWWQSTSTSLSGLWALFGSAQMFWLLRVAIYLPFEMPFDAICQNEEGTASETVEDFSIIFTQFISTCAIRI